MLYSIKNIEELEKLQELVSLEKQVQELRLEDKSGIHNFHEKTKKYIFEPHTIKSKIPLKN